MTVAEAADIAYDSLSEGLLVVNVGNASNKIAATRYVKIHISGHKNWGFQIREAAVLSTEQNAEVVEIQACDNPASFEVSSNNFSEITYTIVSGEDQEGYTYNVYLNGKIVAEDVAAGTYTLKDIAQGTYTLQVFAHYNGMVSDGITKEVYVDDGSYVEYIDSERNIAKGCAVTLEPMEMEQEEGSKDTAALVDTVISGGSANTVQSEWGAKEAVITLDLGQPYNAHEIEEVILAFKADNTYSSDYTIQFSSDGTNYETVYTATDVVYSEFLEDKVDVSDYTQDIVRYVKIDLNDGSYTWGYQIYEVAVISKDASDSEIVISGDVKIEGFQISTTYEGSKVIGSVEPEINGQKVVNW